MITHQYHFRQGNFEINQTLLKFNDKVNFRLVHSLFQVEFQNFKVVKVFLKLNYDFQQSFQRFKQMAILTFFQLI